MEQLNVTEAMQAARDRDWMEWAEHGGPTAWSPKQVSTWKMLGLTSQAAREWQRSGWSVGHAETYSLALEELTADGVSHSTISGLPRPTKHPAGYWHDVGVFNLVWALVFEDYELEPKLVADIGPWEAMAGVRRGATSREILAYHQTECTAEVIDACARMKITPTDMGLWDPAELETLIAFLEARRQLGDLPTFIRCRGYEAALLQMGEDPEEISIARASYSPNLFAHSRPRPTDEDPLDDELYRAAIESGASEILARMAADLGIHPSMVKGGLRQAEGFISAASFHDLAYAAELLEDAEGDPDRAWQMWADNFPED